MAQRSGLPLSFHRGFPIKPVNTVEGMVANLFERKRLDTLSGGIHEFIGEF
jgi:hypothetical protein